MNGYDSVFANANDEELDFDVMFDQEDSLIDTIVGCDEAGDPLTGAEECPAKTADERSCDDCNPDYDKDIDADDTKDAPNDAEGTVGYDFETSPENKGKVDDNTKPDPEHVEGEDQYQSSKDSVSGVDDTVTGTVDNNKDIMEAYFKEAEDELGYEEKDSEEDRLLDASEDVMEAYFREAEDELNGQDTNPRVNAEDRSCDDCNPDYDKDIDADDTEAPKDAEGTVGYDFETSPENKSKVDDQTTVDYKDVKIDEDVDFEYDITVPKDAEGSVGYDIEINPEIAGKIDDQTTVDYKDVKIDEEADYDIPMDGTEKTSPAGPTEELDDGCCKEVGYNFSESTKSVDKEVEKLEQPEDDLDDEILDDVESKERKINLDYDTSDEDLIDIVLNN